MTAILIFDLWGYQIHLDISYLERGFNNLRPILDEVYVNTEFKAWTRLSRNSILSQVRFQSRANRLTWNGQQKNGR